MHTHVRRLRCYGQLLTPRYSQDSWCQKAVTDQTNERKHAGRLPYQRESFRGLCQWQLEVPPPVVVLRGVTCAADQAVGAKQQHKEHIQRPATAKRPERALATAVTPRP
jgi:hypothetical protein